MKLTRSEILILPAEQLAEVSARMMGFVHQYGSQYRDPVDGTFNFLWQPHKHCHEARQVADWVVGKGHCPISYIHICLCEVMPNGTFHWAWTPEQLTRACLLAFVDNGGEI